MDLFLTNVLREPYPELFALCRKALMLSYGQVKVETKFSINKEVESDSRHGDTVVTPRLMCDYIVQHGGLTLVRHLAELQICC